MISNPDVYKMNNPPVPYFSLILLISFVILVVFVLIMNSQAQPPLKTPRFSVQAESIVGQHIYVITDSKTEKEFIVWSGHGVLLTSPE